MVRKEINEQKSFHKTMGYAQLPLNSPDRFLKSGTGIRLKIPNQKNHICYRREQPHIPKIEMRRNRNASPKDFKTINILAVSTSKPQQSNAHLFDTKFDQRCGVRLARAPFYVNLSKFGKIPTYLTKQNKKTAKSQKPRSSTK